MRIWSLHPRYLDAKGLVALWRETLLAQAVLAGATRGYRHHPQLTRFREGTTPRASLAAYLEEVRQEATRRGYRFDGTRILPVEGPVVPIPVTTGQLTCEWEHLQRKLTVRAPGQVQTLECGRLPEVHPLFHVVEGPVEKWEMAVSEGKGKSRLGPVRRTP